jgi:hypothetical protein
VATYHTTNHMTYLLYDQLTRETLSPLGDVGLGKMNAGTRKRLNIITAMRKAGDIPPSPGAIDESFLALEPTTLDSSQQCSAALYPSWRLGGQGGVRTGLSTGPVTVGALEGE